MLIVNKIDQYYKKIISFNWRKIDKVTLSLLVATGTNSQSQQKPPETSTIRGVNSQILRGRGEIFLIFI